MFVFILEVLNEDGHGSPGRNPGPLAFFNTSRKPSPSAPKKAAASTGVPAPTPPVSDSGAPHPGLRVGGEPTKLRARGVKTKKTLQKPGLSREARVAIRAAVASNPSHPEAKSLYPPVGASKLDDLIPAALRICVAAGSSAEPPSPSTARSLTPVPRPAHGDEWFEDRAPSVSLSQVEDLVETSRMIQHLHERTPPPSLSPSSSAMDLDERARTPPPAAPVAFVTLGDYPWLLRHPMPLSTVFLAQWVFDGLKNGVPESALETLIRTETAPMTAAEKRQVPKKLRAFRQAVAAFAQE